MIESNDEIGSIVRKNVLIEYITQIRSKVLIKKRQAIRKAMERKDYQMILAAEFKDKHNLRRIILS